MFNIKKTKKKKKQGVSNEYETSKEYVKNRKQIRINE